MAEGQLGVSQASAAPNHAQENRRRRDIHRFRMRIIELHIGERLGQVALRFDPRRAPWLGEEVVRHHLALGSCGDAVSNHVRWNPPGRQANAALAVASNPFVDADIRILVGQRTYLPCAAEGVARPGRRAGPSGQQMLEKPAIESKSDV